MKIKNFLIDGIRSIADSVVTKRNYLNPDNGFAEDYVNIQKDVRNVGKDMRKAVDKHGESYIVTRHG